MLEWLQSAAALSMGGPGESEPDRPTGLRRASAPGQEWAAPGLRERLAGSSLTEPGAARRLQDPLSFRCAAVIHVASTPHSASWRPPSSRSNGASDNPLVLAGDGEILPTGNFHTAALALGAEAVAIAIAQSAAPSAERISRLCTTELSGLPANLILTGRPAWRRSEGGDALVTAIRQRAAPLAVHPSVDAGSVEDDAPNAALATLRLEDQLDLFRRLTPSSWCAPRRRWISLDLPQGRGTAAVHKGP